MFTDPTDNQIGAGTEPSNPYGNSDKEMAVYRRRRHEREAAELRHQQAEEQRLQGERKEQIEKEQLIATIDELSARIYAVLESEDWSRAELWTITIKPRTWWRWWKVNKELAVLKFLYDRNRPVYMVSNGTVLFHFKEGDLWGYLCAREITELDNLERCKQRLEEFLQDQTLS